jgi:hypothetical protein
LPTKSATNASLLGFRKCIGVLVCSMCAMIFAVGGGASCQYCADSICL